MVKNNVYYEWFASITVPNPDQVGYWVDLGADSKGRIIKVYNRDIEKWVVLFDVSKDDYVPPFIGSNGNWWVDNRDTGVKATAETPYIGENDHWFTYDPINKVYVDTGIEARGLSAYDVAVKLGFEGSEQDWIDSLSKASEDAAIAALDAANKANEAADKANQAVEEIEGIVDDAIAATDKAEEIASNPPKIVDNDWWIYNYDTKQYVNTGISAIGDAFTYKKEYPSIEAMEADWGTADVKLGEYVIINANDVEDPDDAKVYLKTQNGWKFIVDLSGMQGIQGWSAYEVAVQHGFVGTEAEWVQSLKQPALDAAAEALEAKAQVEATEQAVKEAEALRVTAEQGRVNAENTRVSAETARDTAEQERVSNEATRQANEAVRETQEAAREKNTADAITAVNEAKTAAQQATTNATTAANNANTQAARAKEYADNPPKVGEDGYWYLWDEVNDVYVNTGWPSSGIILKGRLNSPDELGNIVDPQLSDSYIVGTDLYFWNGTEWVNMGRFQGPQGEPGKDAELSKAAIEAVLVGEVTTHTHDTRYYTKDQTDASIKVVADDLANNYYNKSQVDSKFTSVYTFKGSVDSVEDLPTEGNVIGDVWNVRKNDTNYAWTSEGWDSLGGTAELASLTANGLMSKEDFAKLQGIEAGAQVNKIETITKRVELNVVNKNVTIPEDVAIGPNEPTNDEIIWMDTDEDYDFTFDGYSKVDADARFVHQVEGKDLSTNDYSNADKNKVDNLNSYVTSGSFTQDANNAAITLNIKDPVTDNNSNQVLTINKATTTTAGVMSAADKTKLDGLSNYDDSTITQDITNIKANKLETIEVTGTGNVITTVTKNGTKIAFAKGITAMTQDTSDARYVKKTGLEDTLAYWYENNENASSTTCLTGGNRNVIESLRSKFKRCIARPYGDDAALISYLSETNSYKWPDDTTAEWGINDKSNLMVHFPKYYHKTIERSPGIWRTYISEQQIDSDYIEEPEMLLGAFEAIKFSDKDYISSVYNQVSTASQTITTFVTQAKANGSMWGIGDYRSHATIARMFCAYYKTTNISTSNSSIPCSGGTKRYNYGKTGGTMTLGNRDGKAAVVEDTGYYSTNFLGIEDCYYSKWEFVQGINLLKGKYVVYDGGSFPDKDVADLEAAGATNIRVVGYEPNPAATNGYNGWTKAVAQGKYGDVVPTAHGGSETTYYSDYSWFNPTANRIFLRSGASGIGSQCGVFVANANPASSYSWANIGARLAFYGKIVVVDSDTFKKMQA